MTRPAYLVRGRGLLRAEVSPGAAGRLAPWPPGRSPGARARPGPDQSLGAFASAAVISGISRGQRARPLTGG
jgi:hypothetical protein